MFFPEDPVEGHNEIEVGLVLNDPIAAVFDKRDREAEFLGNFSKLPFLVIGEGTPLALRIKPQHIGLVRKQGVQRHIAEAGTGE